MTQLLVRALALLFFTALAIHAAPLSGTKSVGPTGDYASLTAAIADVQTQTLGGALVLELQATYVSSVETFPLTIPALNGASAVNSLTIRPAADATALSITSAGTTAATVDLNGANFLTIDGRPGGTGTAKQLTIANTNTSGAALRFVNEASNNTARFLTLQSVNTNSGTVFFSATAGANGNDNNTIDHCDICDGASTPANGLYASGSGATTAKNNSGNTISNCNIFNFYSNGDAAGVRLDGGNTDWTITGNSFYQTASRAAVAGNVRAIYTNNTAGNNFAVTGNFIGGSAPNCGGTAWTTTDTGAACLFQGIRLNVGTTTASSVQGNTIANIVWTSSSSASTLPGVWCGIYAQAGNVNIGTVTGNTLGSGSGTGSIFVTTSGSGGTTFGIGNSGNGTAVITGNTIGSITANGSSSSVSASIYGIQVMSGANTINNNLVGSTTTANSLNAATSSTSTTGQQVTGILSSSSISSIITGNLAANLNNSYVGSSLAGQIRGIVTSAGVNTITSNTVRNLSTTSNTPGGEAAVGIAQSSITAGQIVSQNVVHSIASTAASVNVLVTGIHYAGAATGSNVIARNLVHSLSITSTNAGATLTGMLLNAGAFTVQNNMVRVGLDANGNSTAGISFVHGIDDLGTTAGRNFYHNSVYLGGSQTSGSVSTVAFISSGSANARAFQNNLFVNARSNSGGTGKHYAVIYGGTTANPAGLTASGNLFYAPNTASGSVIGLYNGTDCITLAAWQTATGQDATSLNTDPLFIAPTGTAATVDLHVPANSPANNAGLALASVTDDFDGSPRSHSAPDIGADEILSNNANLASLSLDSGAINPVFSAATTSYIITVPNGTTTVSASVSTADNLASVLISGGSNLVVGANPLTITVVSPDTFVTKTYTVTITRNSVFQDWAAANGVTANSGNAADTSDYDHDGLPNLIEWACNLNPTTASALPATVANNGANLEFTYTRSVSALNTGAVFAVEWSDTLGNDWQGTGVSETILSNDGTVQQVKATLPAGSNGRRFVHLKITAPAN